MPDPCLAPEPPFRVWAPLSGPWASLSGGHRGEPPRPRHRRGAPSWPSGSPGSARPVPPAPVPVPLPAAPNAPAPLHALCAARRRFSPVTGSPPRSSSAWTPSRARPRRPEGSADTPRPQTCSACGACTAGRRHGGVRHGDGVGDLLVGRVPQGIATGIAPGGGWVRPYRTSTAHAARNTQHATRAPTGPCQAFVPAPARCCPASSCSTCRHPRTWPPGGPVVTGVLALPAAGHRAPEPGSPLAPRNVRCR